MERLHDDVIQRTARRYYKGALWVVVAATLVALLAANLMLNEALIVPIVISAVFSLCTGFAYGAAWKGVAKAAPQTLTKFYLAAPALRMILAALVVAVYCVAVRQPDKIRLFAVVFFIFYIVTLVFDSVFFARIEKLNKNHKE